MILTQQVAMSGVHAQRRLATSLAAVSQADSKVTMGFKIEMAMAQNYGTK